MCPRAPNPPQGDSLSNPQYRNTMDCLRQSVAVEGYRGLMRGFSAAMYRAVPVNAGIFLAVEGTRTLIDKVRAASWRRRPRMARPSLPGPAQSA